MKGVEPTPPSYDTTTSSHQARQRRRRRNELLVLGVIVVLLAGLIYIASNDVWESLFSIESESE